MGYTATKKNPARKPAVKTSRAPAKNAVASKPAAASANRPHQQEIMHRLRRVEGQIRGVLQMMEQEQPCDAIAQQLSAARKALDRAFYEMMACNLEMELSGAPSKAAVSERIGSMTRLLSKYA